MKTQIKSILALLFMLAGVSLAQDKAVVAWEKSVQGGINLTQTGYDNWKAGGENVFAWQMNLNYKFIREHDRMSWSNTGKILYGANKTGDADLRKAADEIKMESVLTFNKGARANPFIAVTGETQFAAGYDYSTDSTVQISAFLDPGYFRESFGVEHEISEDMSTRLGLSAKQTITSDYPVPYADDIETAEIETFRSEIGAESVTDLTAKISDNSIYVTKLELFTAFTTLNKVDVNWDNTLTVNISEYLNMNMNFKMVYDRNVSTKRQIKQSMAIGLNYTFI